MDKFIDGLIAIGIPFLAVLLMICFWFFLAMVFDDCFNRKSKR